MKPKTRQAIYQAVSARFILQIGFILQKPKASQIETPSVFRHNFQ